ncbi:MAG: tetratricopeptide repeat protein [Bacteroidales bacterium]|nr:tetratricopeptide repeat protein [Bacteroidales bacterium]
MRNEKPIKQKHGKSLYPDLQEQFPAVKYLIWLPLIFALILYGNTLGHDFALDDLPQIANHKYVQQGWDGLSKLATQNYWAASGLNLGYYRPLSHISFAIENALHGNNPLIMHLVNVLLYGLTGMVVFALLSALFRKMPFFVLAATLLFIAHPVHTEVVANIKSRDEILSFLNGTLALLMVFNFSKSKNKTSLVLALIFYFFALLSKETAMTTLAVVPFLLYFFTPKKGSYIAGVTLAFVGVSVGFLLLKYSLIGTLSGNPPVDINNYPYRDLALRIPTTLYIFGFYLFRLAFPFRLLYDYSYNQVPEVGWGNPVVWLSLVIVAVLIAIAIKNLKRRNIVSFAIIYFGISMSVGLAFVLMRGGIMAERFLYAPVLGFSVLVTYYLFKLLPREKTTGRVLYDFKPLPSRVFLGLITLLILFFSTRTITRNPVWKDNYTLFSNDIRYGGNSAQLRKHYGSELVNQAVAATDREVKDSLMKLGVAELQKSVEINPRFGEAYFKLGYAAYQNRDYDTSIGYYKKASANSMTAANLALSYYMKGDYAEALKLLKQALQMDPENPTARNNMSLVQNAFNKKLDTMKNSTSEDPDHYFELGNLFVEQQKYADALVQFQKSVELRPEYVGAMINIGNCYYMLKDYDNAILTFQSVLTLSPNNQIANRNLSHLYGLTGNTELQQLYDKRAKGN